MVHSVQTHVALVALTTVVIAAVVHVVADAQAVMAGAMVVVVKHVEKHVLADAVHIVLIAV